MGRLGAHPNIVSVFDLGEEPLQDSGIVGLGLQRLSHSSSRS